MRHTEHDMSVSGERIGGTLAPGDLVERLRKQGRWVVTKRVPLFPQMDEEEWRPDLLCTEAADEIERLRAGIEEAMGWTDSSGECGQRLYNLLHKDADHG